MPIRTSTRRVRTELALVALLSSATGCFSSILAGVPPPGLELEPAPTGGACPDLTGTYDNAAVADTSPGPSRRQASREPRGRHLAAFFAGAGDPARVARVALSRSSVDTLSVELVDADGASRHLRLRERIDYRCNGAALIFDGSPLLRQRNGGSFRFGRRPDGCLVEHTRYRDTLIALTILPIGDTVSEEWNLFCGPQLETSR
jgi:hypothetical protein